MHVCIYFFSTVVFFFLDFRVIDATKTGEKMRAFIKMVKKNHLEQ